MNLTYPTTKAVCAGFLLILLPVMQLLNLILVRDDMSRKVISDLLQALAAIIAAAAAILAAKRLRVERSPSSSGWMLISVAACLFAIGMIAFMYVEVVLKQLPYPSFAEIFFLLFDVVIIFGIISLPYESIRQRERWNVILDVAALIIVASMFIWHFNLRILLHSLAVAPSLGVIASLTYTFLDSCLLVLLFYRLVRRLGQGRQFVPMLLLVTGSFFLITADLLQGYVATQSNFTSGSPIDMGWVLFSTFLGIAALYIHRHGDCQLESAPDNRSGFDYSRSAWTVSLTYLWIAMTLIMLVWAVFNQEKINLWLLVAGLLGATTLAVTRQIRSLQDNADLYGKLQKAHAQLEETVSERTSELKASESKLRSILVSTPVGIIILNHERTIISVNARVSEMLGYEEEELPGNSTSMFYFSPEDFLHVGQELYVAMRNHPYVQTEAKMRRKDGSRIDVLLSAALLHPEEIDSDFVVTIMDMTERRHLEQQLIQQQKLEGIGMLAGGMAHDINNLLTPIFISAEMAARKMPGDHPAKAKLDSILEAAVRIKDLVAQVLLFSRKQHSELNPLDLNCVVSDFMGMLRRTIRENISIDLRISQAPCGIMADRTQMEQILMNLAVNAQDAIEGSGQIIVETGYLFLDSEYCSYYPGVAPGKYCLLAFTDSGSGIDEATRLKIFEPFFTTKPKGKGTGLGLSTVYGIVRQHGGHLDLLSTIGSGTTFRIFLPMLDAAVSIPANKIAAISENVAILKGSLLLVEDNDMLRESIFEALSEHGISTVAVASPHEALRLFKEQQETISFLLTDVIMPEMNGPELYNKLKLVQPNLPVLFMSGYAEDIEPFSGVSRNPAIFLPKPFTIQKLLQKLTHLLNSGSNIS